MRNAGARPWPRISARSLGSEIDQAALTARTAAAAIAGVIADSPADRDQWRR